MTYRDQLTGVSVGRRLMRRPDLCVKLFYCTDISMFIIIIIIIMITGSTGTIRHVRAIRSEAVDDHRAAPQQKEDLPLDQRRWMTIVWRPGKRKMCRWIRAVGLEAVDDHRVAPQQKVDEPLDQRRWIRGGG
jgi:hypothetical protein